MKTLYCPIRLKYLSHEHCRECYESNGAIQTNPIEIKEPTKRGKTRKAKLPAINVKPQESPFCISTHGYLERIKSEVTN